MRLTPNNPIVYYWKCENGHRSEKPTPVKVCKECGNRYYVCKQCGSRVHLEAAVERVKEDV